MLISQILVLRSQLELGHPFAETPALEGGAIGAQELWGLR